MISYSPLLFSFLSVRTAEPIGSTEHTEIMAGPLEITPQVSEHDLAGPPHIPIVLRKKSQNEVDDDGVITVKPRKKVIIMHPDGQG